MKIQNYQNKKSSGPFGKLFIRRDSGHALNFTLVNKGFTLVEMLVSIAVFMVVMTVAVGSLVSVIDANRKAQSVKSVMNNLSFALESMGKTIRVGRDYTSSEDNKSFSFVYPGDFNQDDVLSAEGGDRITYKFRENLDGTGEITRQVEGDFEVPITAPEVRIKKLGFYTDNIENLRVLIAIDGVAGTKEKTKTDFSIQTTVTRIGF